MRNSGMSKISIFISFFIVAILFHNCGTNNNVQFYANDPHRSLSSAESADTGEGFFGKPRLGDYVRTYPAYDCENHKINEQGALTVDAKNIVVTWDSCLNQNFIFDFTQSIVDFSSYNRDYLGIGTAIYEVKENSKLQGEPPATEAWCRWENVDRGTDVVIKIDETLQNSKAKLYLGEKKSDGSWESRIVPLFGVNRSATGENLVYQSSGFELSILKAQDSTQLSRGTLTVNIDKRSLEYSMTCRVASKAAVQDSGTALTSLTTLNTFTTDQQEEVCGHNSVMMCENFENRSLGNISTNAVLQPTEYKNLGWQNYTVRVSTQTTTSYDGNKSMETFMPAGVSSGGGVVSIGLPPSNGYFVRFYLKFSANYKPSSLGDLIITDFNGTQINFSDSFGSAFLRTNINLNGASFPLQSPLTFDQWHCVEFAVKRSTSASSSDGSIEFWIDNNKIINQLNTVVLSSKPDYRDFGVNYVRSCVGNQDLTTGDCLDTTNPDNQHPTQSVWVDNFVVGGQRVGCF